jgi:hypothetical protein
MRKCKSGLAADLRFSLLFCALMFLSLAAVGCAGNSSSPQDGQGVIYVPPTPAATPTSAPQQLISPTPETARPTATPPCTDNLSFQADQTIPDGTQVKPGEQLDKRWEVLNNGSCNWDDQYSLRLIAGKKLGAGEEQALYPARAGTSAIIRIQFIAPEENGVFRSAWQAYNPAEQPFGDPIFIEITVENPSSGDGG